MSNQKTLIQSLDHLKSILSDLVEVAQREQRHLIAFEPDAIQQCNAERAQLLEDQEVVEVRVRNSMELVRREMKIDGDKAPTLVKMADFLPIPMQKVLRERCACLQALAGTLRELHSMNALHAERGLRTVRGYMQMLAGSAKDAGAQTYTARGRSRNENGGLATVHGAL